ncbi:MAG TPA: carboxypeptidase-like regulatory domain-containing protein, partial [Blastocatellia bacterium]|nr:carboxypeptidase-like regulatory domain-containing protein [Blastocatellia bacterium]
MKKVAYHKTNFAVSSRTASSSLLVLVALLIGAGLPIQVAQAQTVDTATIRGRVVDQNGAVVADTHILISNELTGFRRETTTDNNGYYSVAGLPLSGKYRVAVSKPGFASEEISDIELRAGEAATFDITLKPEGSRSEITIFGTTEGVRSDSPQLSTRLDLEKI